MCVCTSRQSARCTHALRETRQQLCILPRNQIYSAAASYFRPHCSRSLLIAIARQTPRSKLRRAENIAKQPAKLPACHCKALPAAALRNVLRRCNVEYRHRDDLVCLSVNLFVTYETSDCYLPWQYCNVTLLSLVRLGLYYKMYMNNISV